ncbi:PEP-CTERM sorting domain-containing protein [Crocosphaera sp.]|uniref:PEP-CTERM sorting domain-containing protein n=1 Tax=Crocosphaera sp. TaxID=2729996 RepID=UPI002634CE2F|nr:PEP-CTERM sorting domain-containing protein [Crocosphaera sp.]MDJ0582779.1 PEP-CTERM sorting domain-containing protein [Crocosphaera sp.]
MKKFIHSLFIIGTAALTLGIFVENRPAKALTFAFSQSGWGGDPDAELTVTFSGEDINGNNIIDSAENEVFAYELNFFKGNLSFVDFTHGLNELFFLQYELGETSATIVSSGTASGINSNYNSQGGFNNNGAIGQTGQPNSITPPPDETVNIKEVPESRSWIGLMLFSLGAYFKRNISTKSLNEKATTLIPSDFQCGVSSK